MDTILLSIYGVFLLIYLIGQSLFLRSVNRYTSISWQIHYAGISMCVSFFLSFSIFLAGHYSLLESIFDSFLIGVLFLVSIIIYLLGPYSYLESSITLKIFMLIAQSKNGISQKKLLQKYNSEVIVERRIRRFLAQKEIIQDGNFYFKNSLVSVFAARGKLVDVVHFLFP